MSARTTGQSNTSSVKNRASVSETQVPVNKSQSQGQESGDLDYAFGGYDFGGPIGVSIMMIGFPIIMWYLWICATFKGGKLWLPAEGQSLADFCNEFYQLFYNHALPSLSTYVGFYLFFFVQAVFYATLPGVTGYGLPLKHLGGKALPYFCNAVYSFYTTIVIALALHFTGVFPLYTIIDKFGEIMTVCIFTGFFFSFALYFFTIATGAQHRMSGNFIYDVFMGANLNPRTGIIDWKMFFEVRLPWFILFFITLGAAFKQYEVYGYVTPQVAFILLAHWLYVNACCKGEQLIITSWDMFYEKFGFMLIFWNIAGVPFTYCHCTLYLINHKPSDYQWPLTYNIFLYVLLLISYYFFDTANSQKNAFRQMRQGTLIVRKAFPQLPYRTIKNPNFIQCKNGGTLLTSGWFGYARKANYTADYVMCLSWALMCGTDSLLPFFFPLFFFIVLVHRAYRDIERLEKKYGDDYDEYKKVVPYIFIPYIF
ncbi:ERG4/ERG24 ergosterol biosynthesis protein [Nadsonia fulvescens var. elongata DSM 6958]|uniref:Delta(24(24(1)))-sterol reductase n=1 Tax=Nadsonia fulvescens var. elongata DSM 6958 TaxID=857566 RepID=A0A1E3PQ03_9ASCO|nr:ERG4/ERG24 ergosterol biosynthesis protein [Nadsonia fulvescens var. elongata DSM 6958]